MQWYEILIIVLAAAFVLGVIIMSLIRKKQGKSSCGCDCSGCSGCSACKGKDKDRKEN